MRFTMGVGVWITVIIVGFSCLFLGFLIGLGVSDRWWRKNVTKYAPLIPPSIKSEELACQAVVGYG